MFPLLACKKRRCLHYRTLGSQYFNSLLHATSLFSSALGSAVCVCLPSERTCAARGRRRPRQRGSDARHAESRAVSQRSRDEPEDVSEYIYENALQNKTKYNITTDYGAQYINLSICASKLNLHNQITNVLDCVTVVCVLFV